MSKYEDIPYSPKADMFINHYCPGRQTRENKLSQEKDERKLMSAQSKLLAHLKTYISYRNCIKRDIKHVSENYDFESFFNDELSLFLDENPPAKKLVDYYIKNLNN